MKQSGISHTIHNFLILETNLDIKWKRSCKALHLKSLGLILFSVVFSELYALELTTIASEAFKDVTVTWDL